MRSDLIDKGPQSLAVIERLRELEASAAKAGGTVVVLLGNHEAELFADPTNDKTTGSDGIVRELEAAGVSPDDFAAGRDPRGAWLRERPLGARVDDLFFAHGGGTGGATLAALDAELAAARAKSFAEPAFTGGGSILEARTWWTGVDAAAWRRALGVSRVVFGHDPNALGPRGAIAVADGLARIECGMSPVVDDSTGCLFRVSDEGGVEVARELRATRESREHWRTAR